MLHETTLSSDTLSNETTHTLRAIAVLAYPERARRAEEILLSGFDISEKDIIARLRSEFDVELVKMYNVDVEVVNWFAVVFYLDCINS